jgi:tRNA-specific 2-thiouridylase
MNIAVLVSGGVDSSVALALLKEQGHAVTAFYLKIWLEDELSYLGSCPWQEDLSYVQATCVQLNVPLEVISMQREYHEQVVSYTLASIRAGRTPNPDIMCNSRIKFGLFIKALDERGCHFDKIASGHYAQVQEKNGLYYLMQSPDPVKDQTYFLSHLTQAQLSRVLFPIGHLEKSQVRALAQILNLPTKERKDSQGICFLGKFKFNDFVRHHLGNMPGPLIEHETGMVLGRHQGFWFHTIGQRHGSGLSGGPWYVVAKDPVANSVFVSRNYYSVDKKRDRCYVQECSWITGVPEKNNLTVKVRHGLSFHACNLLLDSHDSGVVQLATHDQGLAAGQFAVFYDGPICLGAGVIDGFIRKR